MIVRATYQVNIIRRGDAVTDPTNQCRSSCAATATDRQSRCQRQEREWTSDADAVQSSDQRARNCESQTKPIPAYNFQFQRFGPFGYDIVSLSPSIYFNFFNKTSSYWMLLKKKKTNKQNGVVFCQVFKFLLSINSFFHSQRSFNSLSRSRLSLA